MEVITGAVKKMTVKGSSLYLMLEDENVGEEVDPVMVNLNNGVMFSNKIKVGDKVSVEGHEPQMELIKDKKEEHECSVFKSGGYKLTVNDVEIATIAPAPGSNPVVVAPELPRVALPPDKSGQVCKKCGLKIKLMCVHTNPKEGTARRIYKCGCGSTT